ncbi:MAG TPA: hypothetical protein VFH94_11965 [Streptomyces sp.]|nr:hypothetical protein [Streptomyces sp.]
MGSVRNQLIGFLASVEERAAHYAPDLATWVTAKLDEAFAITAALPAAEG